jgi:hypothetical protein
MLVLSKDIKKSDIQSAANKVINEVLDGNLVPVETYVQLKAIDSACKQAIKGIEEEAIDKSYDYPGKSFVVFGATVTKKEGSLLLDYEVDPVYMKMKEMLKQREEQLKTAYEMDRHGDVYITSDGEQLPVVPPKRTKPTLAVTFKAE